MTDWNPRLLPFAYTNSHADQLAKLAYETLPPSSNEGLPDFWIYSNVQEFTTKFSYLGPVVWCRRNAYHRLLIHGHQVMRFWTTDANPRAELAEGIANVISGTGIKGLTPMRGKYYTHWVQIRSEAEVKILMNTMRKTYGL